MRHFLLALFLTCQLAMGAFPGSFPSDPSSYEIGAGPGGTGSFFHSDDDGFVQYCGGSDNVSGACVKAYGDGHAKTGDLDITDAAGTTIFAHDDSARLVTIGDTADGFRTKFQSGIRLLTDTDNLAYYSLDGTAGALVINSGVDTAGGPRLRMNGSTFAVNPEDVMLATSAGADILAWDFSISELELGLAGTGDVQINGDALAFFEGAPAAQAAAYTPTNVTPDRAYDADTVVIAELADIVGTLIADLQAYNLLQ